MFTLISYNGQFNRPDTLIPFLESNLGNSPLLQIDCVTPYYGTTQDLIKEVCDHLSKNVPNVEVTYNATKNASTESNTEGCFVKYLVIQVNIKEKNKKDYCEVAI
jgi:phosphatidate phosphatase APP1